MIKTDQLNEEGVRIQVIGDVEALSDLARQSIARAEEKTKNNDSWDSISPSIMEAEPKLSGQLSVSLGKCKTALWRLTDIDDGR